ncbi:MAG: nucleoside triphosphate pyrophosphohydrolase, partial [Sphaerospermopsis sp. SIO1G2]|nr:nucleoside triphosphate pyrophosphohydrolase [Sphaerospermopsis sp. SIO1G2]
RSDLTALAEAVATLRGPDGCPWDQKQTPQSMRDGFLEEAYEVLEALDYDDIEGVCEELGDILLHVTMQAQMAAEVGDFTLSDVIAGIYAKIVRRHPHVWGEVAVENSEQVVLNWDEIKAQEKAGKPVDSSVLGNIPIALPALVRSQKIQRRAAKSGFDWEEIQGVYDKIEEEIAEVRAADSDAERVNELGDVPFTVVNLAKWLGVDAEIALREANMKFEKRFRAVEGLARQRDLILSEQTEGVLIDLWNEAKLTVD